MKNLAFSLKKKAEKQWINPANFVTETKKKFETMKFELAVNMKKWLERHISCKDCSSFVSNYPDKSFVS